MATLPPGIDASTFAKILDELAAVVGKEWVFSSDEDVALYRDAYSVFWDEAEERVASAAVAPDSTEQVQAIVRIANRYRLPIYPISTGRNLTYGGSAPNMSGSVVVDLKRMNRILQVDDTRNFALVEPGVSYFDLYRYIQERGLKVWIDCPEPGWGSPIGNALDHGVGFTWGNFRDHFGSRCGMEVVLPNGELLRTGMGALPGADMWQDFRYNVGPQVDGLFGQANFGIVTKMGFWLMPEPECYMTAKVRVPKYMDLIPLVKVTNYLDDSGLVGMPSYSSPIIPPPGSSADPDLVALSAKGWPSVDEIEAFVRKKGRPAFSVELRFYGPEETCKGSWIAAKRRYSAAIPGATFEDGVLIRTPFSEEDKNKVRKTTIGVPNLNVFSVISRNSASPQNPQDGHTDLFPNFPRTGEACMKIARVLFEFARANNNPPITSSVFLAPTAFYPRSFFVTAAVLPTYRDNPEGNKRTRELLINMVDELAKHGFGDYRTAPAFQDHLVSTYSFNNGALLKYQQLLKDATDPNGIIAPGRYGLWPAGKRPHA